GGVGGSHLAQRRLATTPRTRRLDGDTRTLLALRDVLKRRLSAVASGFDDKSTVGTRASREPQHPVAALALLPRGFEVALSQPRDRLAARAQVSDLLDEGAHRAPPFALAMAASYAAIKAHAGHWIRSHRALPVIGPVA